GQQPAGLNILAQTNVEIARLSRNSRPEFKAWVLRHFLVRDKLERVMVFHVAGKLRKIGARRGDDFNPAVARYINGIILAKAEVCASNLNHGASGKTNQPRLLIAIVK